MGLMEKNFTPAHTTTVLMPMGKVLILMTQHHPDSWNVTLLGTGIDNPDEITFTVSVDKDARNEWQIGDTVDNPNYHSSEGVAPPSVPTIPGQ